jgi:dihydropyrimidinase
MSTVLIKNGRIVTAVDDYAADILVEDGRIATIGRAIAVGDDVEVHDAKGLLVLPGGIDVHTHLDWDFGVARTVDTFGTGTRAAAFGGTTTVVDFCNQTRGESLLSGLEDWHKRAESACVDVGAHMIIIDVNDQTLADVKTLMASEGVTSFKLFTAYPGVLMVDDGTISKTMRLAAEGGGMCSVHCENGPVIQMLVEEAVAAGNLSPKYHMLTRPPLCEAEATHRAIRLAEMAGAPLYVVHMSAAAAVAALIEARDRGQVVYGETCPHYLFLTREEYDRPGFEGAKYVMSPPLRGEEDQDALWRAIATGHMDTVATDHCPFCFSAETHGMKMSKQQGTENFAKIPNGAPGIEERMSLMFNGMVHQRGMSINRFVEMTSTAAAKLFGLFPKKGTIAVGSDADIVVFDPDETWTIEAANGHGRMDYSLFEGYQVTGRTRKVFTRGRLVVDGETWLGREGMGEFLSRGPCGAL